ncbi:MAG TPA: hypothetical protein VIV11_42835 [Kofleriaceae bacterium]
MAAALAGCTGTGDVEYAGEVRVTSPELIVISPGVQVIADADEPIFYSHGHYWLYRDGYWLRSSDYRSGYVSIDFTYVPQEIRVIERPQLYVQYRRNLGRDRAARSPNLRTRSQPTYQQPPQRAQPQPTYPPPAPQQPGYRDPAQPPTSPSSPVHQPRLDPKQPTTPPGPHDRVITPNDNRREPTPQRQVPPEIDHTSPGKAAPPPDHATGPQDKAPPGQANKDPHEHVPPSDRSDRATPPGQTKTDDRTKKPDEKKNKDKTDK